MLFGTRGGGGLCAGHIRPWAPDMTFPFCPRDLPQHGDSRVIPDAAPYEACCSLGYRNRLAFSMEAVVYVGVAAAGGRRAVPAGSSRLRGIPRRRGR